MKRVEKPELSSCDLSIAVGGCKVDTTPREFEILAELMRKSGRVVRLEALLARLGGFGSSRTPRSVDAHVQSLRQKLGGGARIETVHGVGYRFEDVGPH